MLPDSSGCLHTSSTGHAHSWHLWVFVQLTGLHTILLHTYFLQLVSATSDFLCCSLKNKFLKNRIDLFCIILYIVEAQYMQLMTHITTSKSEVLCLVYNINIFTRNGH